MGAVVLALDGSYCGGGCRWKKYLIVEELYSGCSAGSWTKYIIVVELHAGCGGTDTRWWLRQLDNLAESD